MKKLKRARTSQARCPTRTNFLISSRSNRDLKRNPGSVYIKGSLSACNCRSFADSFTDLVNGRAELFEGAADHAANSIAKGIGQPHPGTSTRNLTSQAMPLAKPCTEKTGKHKRTFMTTGTAPAHRRISSRVPRITRQIALRKGCPSQVPGNFNQKPDKSSNAPGETLHRENRKTQTYIHDYRDNSRTSPNLFEGAAHHAANNIAKGLPIASARNLFRSRPDFHSLRNNALF